jgi:hypothetical protein
VIDPFDRAEESALLADWFDNVQFDEAPQGIPPLADEDDDE